MLTVMELAVGKAEPRQEAKESKSVYERATADRLYGGGR